MTSVEMLQLLLLTAGCVFYLVGTLGLFRFPDTLTRIHALTKVDNLGLGLVVVTLLPLAESPAVALKLILVWVVALAASATAAHLVARATRSAPDGGRSGGDTGRD